MTTPHSPTPGMWIAGVDAMPPRGNFDTDDVYSEHDGKALAVCRMTGDVEHSHANARTIVRCVNSHDDLVAACKRMIRAMGAHGPCRNNDCQECAAAWEKGQEALRKAEA